MNIQNIPIKVINVSVDFLDEAAYEAKLREEELGRQLLLQQQMNERFTDYEQSILWQCMNDKVSPNLHKELNSIVERNMTEAPVELYRGVSKSTLHKLMDLEVGDIFEDVRVTSFSSDFGVARQFAGSYTYGTHVILSLRNAPWAYDYSTDMEKLIQAAPDSEFMHSDMMFDERMDKLEMVRSEYEWMFPIGTKFRIVEIDDVQYDPNARSYCIYHLEVIK